MQFKTRQDKGKGKERDRYNMIQYKTRPNKRHRQTRQDKTKRQNKIRQDNTRQNQIIPDKADKTKTKTKK